MEKQQGLLEKDHGICAYIVTVMVLCFVFYVMGLYVGRWSNTQALASSEAPAVAKTETRASAPAAPLPAKEKYIVQVLSTSTQAEAHTALGKLRRAGFDSAHMLPPLPNSVTPLYTVRVGPYNQEIANQVAEELQKEHGFKGVMITPQPVE